MGAIPPTINTVELVYFIRKGAVIKWVWRSRFLCAIIRQQ